MNTNELRSAGELDLSRDEDSVMSLAVGPSKGRTTLVYAGVNSSPASVAKGRNEHLRTFAVEQTKARQSAGNKAPAVKIAELSRSSMFTDPDEGTFQRLLRVRSGIGAAATALGKESQLAVFETPTGAAPKLRGVMELPRDAEDLDLVQTGDGEYQLAFCYKYEIHVVSIDKEKMGDPQLVYTMPEENSVRPAFRSIRYLSPDFILAVSNAPAGKGIILQGLRMPTPGNDNARMAVTARIPRAIKATAMAVTNLSPPSSPTSPLGDTQFVIAVAANDASISLFTLESTTSSSLTLLTRLYPLHTIKDAHDGGANITALAFSTFVTPKTHIRPQHIKLASTSLGNSVAVHSIPLTRHIDRTPRNKKGPPRPVRYVVAMKSQGPSARPLIIILSVMVLIMAIVGQSILEMYGHSRPVIYSHKFLPSWHGSLRSAKHPPPALMDEGFVAKLRGNKPTTGGEEKLVVLLQGEEAPTVDVHVHREDVHGEAREWDDLPEEQKEAWREKLGEAGAWTRDMGESVLKGIFFGELAGMVGQAVGG